jgi:hypothetical protein
MFVEAELPKPREGWESGASVARRRWLWGGPWAPGLDVYGLCAFRDDSPAYPWKLHGRMRVAVLAAVVLR